MVAASGMARNRSIAAITKTARSNESPPGPKPLYNPWVLLDGL